MTASSTERNRRWYLKMTPSERTARRTLYACRRRIALLKEIAEPGAYGGGLCAGCGTEHAYSELEVDHVDKITWDHRSISSHVRVARYWKERKAGVRLRALCRGCNAKDGGRRRWRRRI